MSFQAMTWAVSQRCENAGQKLVLIMLANCCNSHTGQCNPSHSRLAEECSMGVSTLKAHLAKLAEMGLLTIEQRSSEGVSLPNQYHMNIEYWGGGPESDRGVGQNLAGGGSESGYKPGTEPGNRTKKDAREAPPPAKPTRTRKQAYDPNTYQLPDCIDPELWRCWNAIRGKKGNPLLLPEQCEYQILKLKRYEDLFSGGANESLYRSVQEGWIGLRKPDKKHIPYTIRQMEKLFEGAAA